MNVNNSNGNKIVGNLVNNNSEIGISLYGSDENTISKNAVNYNKNMGIFLSSCGSNAILENTISYNSNSGVDLFYSHRNTILRNSINYNSPGIRLRSSDYNDIKQNFIKRNFIGVEIGSGWRNDIITNCFTNNQILNALDETANNDWSIWMNGNFWDDYRGLDENNDGIGDTPYTISGSVVNTDEYPWMTCPLPLEDVDEITIEQLIPIYFFPGLLLYTVLILWFLYPERKLKK
ncbi:MAG: nitrous oxide reductase family maturation protein NosD [Candidatus Hermodarchaeota archaeon]